MGQEQLHIRFAKEGEEGIILAFIEKLAAYEKMQDEVVATEETLHEWLFVKKSAETLFAEYEGKIIGFALFFHNFSTFVGRSGMYLEDLFVLPEYRGKGFGKKLLEEVARLGVERGCKRMEWACLDWNQPSIDFYLSLGAKPMQEWTIYRLAGERLKEFGK